MLDKLKKTLWEWPDGVVWRLTEGATVRSRRKKYNIFIETLKPGPDDSILDVGVDNFGGRATNFLELWYPYKGKISALGVGSEEGYAEFKKAYPDVKLILGDGRSLELPDKAFDVVFSNAVVEHVGDTEKQRRFIHELCRVGRKAFVTTPNYWFPVDTHTLLPAVHFLPIPLRYWIYRRFRREYWANIEHLNLLTPSGFMSLFPPTARVKIIRIRMLGLTSSIVAVVE